MEVHHHPEVERKSFKQYLLEGLMIFLAVTMGFFAESLREHINERHKEKEYIVSFLSDLRSDTAEIKTQIQLNLTILRRLDTLQDLILSIPSDQPSIIKAYKFLGATTDAEGVSFSEVTFNQLKNSGDMRLIHLRSVSDSILRYEGGVENCKDQESFYTQQSMKLEGESKFIFLPDYAVFARKAFIVLGDSSVQHRVGHGHFYDSLSVTHPFRFMTKDPDVFRKYCSELVTYNGIITSFVEDIQQQQKSAENLIRFLQETYKLKD
jgi:hypothetical protein